MKYLCLVYVEEKHIFNLPKGEFDALVAEASAFVEDIKKSGQFVASERLLPTQYASTVRERQGRTFITDGPFAETKEQLAGFVLIEAGDLNEAIQVASRFPAVRYGGVEVRPIADYATHGLPPEMSR